MLSARKQRAAISHDATADTSARYSRQRGFHGELDAAALALDVHVRAQVVVEAAQHAIAAMHDACCDAEAMEDVGEFQRHVAAADDQDATRQLRQQERLVRADAELQSRQAFG